MTRCIIIESSLPLAEFIWAMISEACEQYECCYRRCKAIPLHPLFVFVQASRLGESLDTSIKRAQEDSTAQADPHGTWQESTEKRLHPLGASDVQ